MGNIYALFTQREGNTVTLEGRKIITDIPNEALFYVDMFPSLDNPKALSKITPRFFLGQSYPLFILVKEGKFYLEGQSGKYRIVPIPNDSVVQVIPRNKGNWNEFQGNLLELINFPDSLPTDFQAVWRTGLSGQAIFGPLGRKQMNCTPGTIWAPDENGVFACRRAVCEGAKCGELRYIEADGVFVTEECSGSCPGGQICLNKTCQLAPVFLEDKPKPLPKVCPDPSIAPCGTKTITGEYCPGLCPDNQNCISSGFQFKCIPVGSPSSSASIYIFIIITVFILLVISLVLYFRSKRES